MAPHAIACWVFVPYLITWQYPVREGCCTTFHKIIRKTVVMESFLSNVADLQPDTFWLKRDSAMRHNFQSSLSIQILGMAASFSNTVENWQSVTKLIFRCTGLPARLFSKSKAKISQLIKRLFKQRGYLV